jgi:hypothetical protein
MTKKRLKEIGMVLGGLHLIFSLGISFLVMKNAGKDAMWSIIWIPHLIFDFPFSAITLWGFGVDSQIGFLSAPFNSLADFWIPVFNSVVLGTLYWYYLPRFWSYASKKKF